MTLWRRRALDTLCRFCTPIEGCMLYFNSNWARSEAFSSIDGSSSWPCSLLFHRQQKTAAVPSISSSPSEAKESERISLWRQSLPSPEDVAERLRRSCSSSGHTAPSVTTPPMKAWERERDPLSYDWRKIVARAKLLSDHHYKLDSVLTDRFGRKHTYLRISLTEQCNLRCLYCMPEDGVELTPKHDVLNAEEIERLAKLFARAGVNKVRLTGGEPCLRRDLADIVNRVSHIEGIESVGITTNGMTLSRNLAELKSNGLTSVNISLDTLRPDRFERMTRRKGHDRVMRAIQDAVDLGFDPVKVNVVVMKGVNDDEIGDFVDLTRNYPINVRFIEYMPFDGNVWSRAKLVTYREMLEAVRRHASRDTSSPASNVVLRRLDDPAGEVAKNYHLAGHRGTVSFVTSMTSAFCKDCNRLRIMADGNLKVCLFGVNEVSLRDAMRGGATNEDLLAIISAAVNRKKAAHAGMFELARSKNRAMVKIGG